MAPVVIPVLCDGRTIYVTVSAAIHFEEVGEAIDTFRVCTARGRVLGTCAGEVVREFAAELVPAVPGMQVISAWRWAGEVVFDRLPVVAWSVCGSDAEPVVAGRLEEMWCLDQGEEVGEGRFVSPGRWGCDDPDEAARKLRQEIRELDRRAALLEGEANEPAPASAGVH